MNEFKNIESKLAQFSKKYYTNELIKGSIFFFALGILYLLFTLVIEHFLWLKPTFRTLLFWLFIAVELYLLLRFILFPLFKLFGLQKGISPEEASSIIGNHFPEVSDKLTNVLQLQKHGQYSELLQASIAQKSLELETVPFGKAINFTANKKYLLFAAIPVLFWILSFVTGFSSKLSNSLERVLNHQTAYAPPAPFSFALTTDDLKVIKGSSFTLFVQASGTVLPENAKISFQNQEYYLHNEGNGLFSYAFENIQTSFPFFISANGVQSDTYEISVVNTPTIRNIELVLQYPAYLGKKNETLNNAGNVIVPQGTSVQWKVKTSQTTAVQFKHNTKTEAFTTTAEDEFSYRLKALENINYSISTSNENLKNYEELSFSIQVVKDEFPSIIIESNIDSITRGNAQFAGQISDDHGFSKLELNYKSTTDEQANKKSISLSNDLVQSFYYEFPGTIQLPTAGTYELYFTVYDNDRVNGAKRTQSKKFFYRQKSSEELEEELLEEQKGQINQLKQSLQKQQQSKRELEKIQLDLQNKDQLNWSDKKNIQNLLQRQQQYRQMMQKQSQLLQENLEEKEEQNEDLQQKKEDLQKRIEELKKLEKQQKLLDELKKLAEKLSKEELIKKTKELAEQNKQQEKSLERILEMTKRYYVEQKMNQIADKLDKTAKKQEALSNKETQQNDAKKTDTKEQQAKLKKDFDSIKKELKDLKKENSKLKEPMQLPEMDTLQKETEQEMQQAQENLEKNNSEKAKKNQKKAAQKMQEMSKKMQQSMQSMSAEMQEENMESLRQVLENLVTYSFKQEKLMQDFGEINADHPSFSKNLKRQYQLKTYFEHIDDSLFTLSMRVPSISTKIQDELANAHYNIDQSLENLADNRIRRGVSNQQYVMTSANTLADMLSNTLDAMQNPKQGMGKGKGKGKSFSLPDIIQQQNELMEKMKNGMKKSQQGQPKKGKGKQKGKGKEQGQQEGQQGQQSEEMNGKLYQIYKEQAQLRQQLQDALKKGKGGNGNAKKIVEKMEDLENKILEQGFNQGVIERMRQLNYELLKLDKASFEQGRKKERESNTNRKNYGTSNQKSLKFKKLFKNQTEILRRQSLPLRDDLKQKVKNYFNSTQKQ